MLNPDPVNAQWRTSTHSGSQGDCVEVAPGARVVAVRDSKRRDGGILSLPPGAWRAFVRSVGRR